MTCYRCGSDKLPLAPLTPYEREEYPKFGFVLRICGHCGLEQNHAGDGDPLTPQEAVEVAPRVG